MNTELMARSNSIASRVMARGKFGFPVAIVVQLVAALLPLLAQCFQSSDPKATKKYVTDRWNASDAGNEYLGYDERLVKRTAAQARRAARDESKNLSREECIELALCTLEEVRLEGEDKIGACMQEIPSEF